MPQHRQLLLFPSKPPSNIITLPPPGVITAIPSKYSFNKTRQPFGTKKKTLHHGHF